MNWNELSWLGVGWEIQPVHRRPHSYEELKDREISKRVNFEKNSFLAAQFDSFLSENFT